MPGFHALASKLKQQALSRSPNGAMRPLHISQFAAMRNACKPAAAATVPDCVLFDFHEVKGKAPAGRWGHASVVVDEKLYVYGGEGDQAYGDLCVFDSGTNVG